ncbi:MAG: DNA-methyltransferase [Haloechinothrix sp.]
MSVAYSDEVATLHTGDALAVLRTLGDDSVDAVVTDPPYSSGGMVRGDRTQRTRTKYVSTSVTEAAADFTGDNRDQRAYGYWCALWLGEALRITRSGGVCLLFTDWRQLPTTTDALQAGGWVWRGIVPWLKPNARPTAGRFANAAEYVVWGSNGPMGLDFRDACLRGYFHASPPREREHQTQKPVDVLRELVGIAPAGGVVCDPFMGSGTTGVAAVLERRRFLGVEQLPHYVRVAQRRIQQAQLRAVDHGDQTALPFDGTEAA